MRSLGYPNAVIERPAVRSVASAPPVTRTIPFDYVFQFELTGTPTNRVQDVVEISMQGWFVAVSIGYSFVLDERIERRRTFGPVIPAPQPSPTSPPAGQIFFLSKGLSKGRTVSSLTLGEIADGLESIGVGLERGFRINPNFVKFLEADADLSTIQAELAQAFEPGCGPEDTTFFYTIDIPSTGRELQNKPIHNVAGLGIANGDRPFRPFARPVAFEPRTSIRIQVEEISTLSGTLFIVLQGYKTLGTGRTPE
jgi:hypothetical protein